LKLFNYSGLIGLVMGEGDVSLLQRVLSKEGRQETADYTAMVVTEMSGLARPIVREATPSEKRNNPNLEVVQVKVPGNLSSEKVLVILQPDLRGGINR
jgi:hypothetical protein